MAHCDYWWYAGEVEWCDLEGGACKCGGWEDRCAFRGRKKQAEIAQRVPIRHHESRHKMTRHADNL